MMTGLITIDASDLVRVGSTLYKISNLIPVVIPLALDQAARGRVSMLRQFAPSQKRTDVRHPTKLKNSFGWQRSGNTRTITTSTPNKYIWVTGGTQPHMIYPRHPKDALWWPGLSHPVTWVGPPYTRIHPGTRPNNFDARAMQAYEAQGGNQVVAQAIASGTVNAITSGVGNQSLLGLGVIIATVSGLLGAMLVPIAALFQWAADEKED